MTARTSRLRRSVLLLVSGFAGAVVALLAAGGAQCRIGPFDTTVSVRPSLAGYTAMRLAPFGSIELDTHDAPVGLEVRIDELRLEEAERIAADLSVLDTLEDEIANDARRALLLVGVRTSIVAIAGAAIGAVIVSRRARATLTGALAGALVTAVVATTTVATFDAGAVAEPRYSGLLSVAPTAVGDVEAVVARFGEYRAQLTDLVANVLSLYQSAQGLPTFDSDDGAIRVLHVSDIHLNPQAFDLIDLIVDQYDVDVVADTGDITDWGTDPEASLISRIGQLPIPYVWVRGNHDSVGTQAAVAAQPNAIVLHQDAQTVGGLRFWGAADTRYTPNKDQPTGKDAERDGAAAVAPQVAKALRADEPPQVDVALVHDQRMARDLGGTVPLILAGHTHHAREGSIGSSRLLVEGSTGGAGLRGLQGDEPEPLTCTVLYFDPRDLQLVAYDRITLRGLGETGVRIERHVLTDDTGDTDGTDHEDADRTASR